MHRTRPGPRTMGATIHAAVLAVAVGAGPVFAQTQPAAETARPNAVAVNTQTARPAERAGQWLVTVAPDTQMPASGVVSTERDPAAASVNRLFHAGRAEGLGRVLYDNRDAGHSRLRLDRLPQLRETRYGEGFNDTGLDVGLAGPARFDIPVIGNASLALTKGPFKRSLPRLAMQNQATAQAAYELYETNHLYVYPEHRDHDAETGDRFAAQMPYFVISQGSSHTDRPFVRALLLTYAALQPATFERLRDAGLLASTAQMVLRRTRKGITGDAAYYSPAAHPTAFDDDSLRPAAMVALAAAITPDEIPPMVKLKVTRDLRATPGTDYLARNLSERLFTTPGAIARVWRSYAGQRRMQISAEPTTDPNGHPLTFSWVVLRGDPEKVKITPSGPGNARAEIVMDWHDAGEIPGPAGVEARRIEIGVFAHNGFYPSAPAFVSVDLPTHQAREYAGSGADARLWRIDYSSGGEYVDPLIWPVADWNDRLAQGPDGRVEVMTRQHRDASQPYALHRDASGGWTRRSETDAETERVSHFAEGPPERGLMLVEAPAP